MYEGPDKNSLLLAVDFRPLRDIYQSGPFSQILRFIPFEDLVSSILVMKDTSFVWSLLDNELDPSMDIEVLTEYDNEINKFFQLVFQYMNEVHHNEHIYGYQILKFRDDLAQLRAFFEG